VLKNRDKALYEKLQRAAMAVAQKTNMEYLEVFQDRQGFLRQQLTVAFWSNFDDLPFCIDILRLYVVEDDDEELQMRVAVQLRAELGNSP